MDAKALLDPNPAGFALEAQKISPDLLALTIENKVHRIAIHRCSTWLETLIVSLGAYWPSGMYPLRIAIVEVDGQQATFETTVVRYHPDGPYAEKLAEPPILSPRKKEHQSGRFGVVQIIPTGIRCEIGGFAGDACPAANLLAASADFVVTHPNAVNASDINEMADNVLYVEGKSLDDFLLGRLGLMPVASNRIGTFVDPAGIEYIDDVIHTLNAAIAVGGIDCANYTILRKELGVKIRWSEHGCAVGDVLRPEAILEAVEFLIGQGAQAIGGVSVIHGVTKEMFNQHLHGKIPNPSGGIEAIITHLISAIFRIPTAHAPLPYYQHIKNRDTVNPRASAEFISTPHYFSVLKGLSNAPRLVPLAGAADVPCSLISINQIGAIVMPADCLGGIPALAAEFSAIPLIAVKENKTILNVTNAVMQMPNVIEVDSYLEAAGVVLALRQGISLNSLRRPLGGARRIELPPLPAARKDVFLDRIGNVLQMRELVA